MYKLHELIFDEARASNNDDLDLIEIDMSQNPLHRILKKAFHCLFMTKCRRFSLSRNRLLHFLSKERHALSDETNIGDSLVHHYRGNVR